MLKSYFKIAWRNLIKDRQFTLLNLIGLSTGLACTLLIYLWVSDELQVDKFHRNDLRLFQVMANSKEAGGIRTIPQTPALLASTLAKEMPEVEYATATQGSFSGKYTLAAGEKYLKATGLYAGKDYFKVFSYPLIQGNNDQALASKHSIVISKQMALRLFNTTENIIGRKIGIDHTTDYIVSGIFEGTPANSSVQFDFLLPFENFLDAYPDEKNWNNSDPNTYLVLKKGTGHQPVQQEVSRICKIKEQPFRQ